MKKMPLETFLVWFCQSPFGFAVAGGVGGFLIDALHKGFIEFPQKININSHAGYTLGFFAAVIGGVFGGVLADNSMLFSFLAGAGLGGIATGAAAVVRSKNDKRKVDAMVKDIKNKIDKKVVK